MITNPVLPGGGIEIGSLIGGLIGLLIIFGAIAAFIFLLLGALSWITSSGDKAKLEKAQGTITNAILGLIVLAAVWAIMTVLSGFLGLGIFTGNEGTFELPSFGGQTDTRQMERSGAGTGNSGTTGGTSGGNSGGQTTPTCTPFGKQPTAYNNKACCAGTILSNGICLKGNNNPCTNNSDCVSNNCPTANPPAIRTCQPK